MSLQCLQSSFGSIQPTVWKEMSFEERDDLGYQNGTILAIMNLYNAPMPHWMSFEEFQDGPVAAILNIGADRF